ncbi:MAG: hypothetical protein ACT4NL_16040 [Pseudomarimonas sp.]
MSHAPTPSRRRSDGEAIADALAYPFASDALITNLALTLSQLVVGYVPLLGLFLQLLVWMSAYRYALEVMTASGQGRQDPPQGSQLTDSRTQRSHLWIHALVIIALVFAAHLLGAWPAVLLLIGVSLALPGALLALAAAQNLLAAFNPAAWWAVLRIVGPGYLLLSLAIGLTLALQLAGDRIFGELKPTVLGNLLYYFCVHAALFASFRLVGTRLHAHADALGLEQASVTRPILAREREQQQVAREAFAAGNIEDPAAKAAALDPILRRGGASEELHREYRRCLRAAGNLAGLRKHAEVHICELLVLKQTQSALVLATEAFADHPDLFLPDADSTRALQDAALAAGQLRLAAGMVSNYRREFPRRRDGLPLAIRAAVILADRLGDPAAAEALLVAAAAHPDKLDHASEIERLLLRLRAGIALSPNGDANPSPLGRRWREAPDEGSSST